MNNTTTTNDETSLTSTAEAWIVLAFAVPCTLLYAAVVVGSYRVAKRNNTFILFFSHGLADVYTLLWPIVVASEWFFNGHLLADYTLEMNILQLSGYSSYIHVLLIAFNRGWAVLLPVSYSRYWTRRTCLWLVGAVWLVSEMMNAVQLALYYATNKQVNLVYAVLAQLRYVILFGGISIYTMALVHLAYKRLCGMSASHQSALSQRSQTRVFAYCLLSFMPSLLYQIYLDTDTNGQTPQLFSGMLFLVAVHSINGILLLAMSSLVQTHMPLGRLFGCGKRVVQPATFNAAGGAIRTNTIVSPPTIGPLSAGVEF